MPGLEVDTDLGVWQVYETPGHAPSHTALHAEVLGEGVETEEQVTRLLELGCDRGQGHLISPPMSAEEIGRMVAVPS